MQVFLHIFLFFLIPTSLLFSYSLNDIVIYNENITLYYIPQPFDESWSYRIKFNSKTTFNPSYTGESLKDIIKADIPESQSYQLLYKAREQARLAYKAYKECTKIFKFNKDGKVNLQDSVLSIFITAIKNLGEGSLANLISYNYIMSSSLGYKVERRTYTYTEINEEGEEVTKKKTYYSLEYEKSPSYVSQEDSNALVNFAMYLASAIPLLPEITSFLITASEIKDSADACKNYGEYYFNMWINLYEDLNIDIEKLEKSKNTLLKNYENAYFSGFCDEEYGRYGFSECKAIEEEIKQIKNVGKEIKFVKQKLEEMKNSYVPNPINVISISYAVEKFSKRVENLSNNFFISEKQALNNLRQKFSEIKNLNERVANLIENCEREKLYLIDSVYIKDDYLDTKNIYEQYEALKNTKRQLDEDLKNIDSLLKNKPFNYLTIAYKIAYKSEKYYLNDKIINHAKITVEEIRNRVEQKIEELAKKGYETSQIKEKLLNADKKTSLGDKYVSYVSILNSISLLEENKPKSKKDYEDLYVVLNDLINRAAKDGIEVSFYRDQLEKINSMENYLEKYYLLKKLKDDLINQIRTRFSSLKELKSRLESFLALLPNEAITDLLYEKKKLESVVFQNDNIDYEKAAGFLLKLENFYKSSIESMKKELEKQFSYINVNYYFTKPVSNIDEKTAFNINFYLTNPYPVTFQNVEKIIPISMSLSPEDYNLDRGTIKATNNIIWKIPYINPYETLYGEIRKEDIFIKSLSKSVFKYIKNNEGKAEKNYSVEVLTDALLRNELDADVYINKNYYGKKRFIELKKGSYNILFIEKLENFNIWKNNHNCVSLGEETLCKYNINIELKDDVDLINLDLEENATVVMNNKLLSLKNGLLEIKNVKRGSYLLEVSYKIKNVSNYLSKSIKDLENKNLTQEEKEALEKIKTLQNQGFVYQALNDALNLLSSVEKRKNESEKIDDAKNKIIEEIEKAININSSLTKSLITFKEKIKEGKYDYEKEKKKFIDEELKNLWKKFSSIQKFYIENASQSSDVEESFKNFEEAYKEAKLSYNTENLAIASKRLDEIEKNVNDLRIDENEIKEKLKVAQEKINFYDNLEKNAKELKLSSYLPFSSSYFKERLKLFTNLKTLREKKNALNDLNLLIQDVDNAIDAVKKAAENELADLEEQFYYYKINDERLLESLQKTKKALEKGEYLKVIAAVKQLKSNILTKTNTYGKQENLTYYILFFILAVLSAIYLYRDKIKLPWKKEKQKKRIKSYNESENQEE